VGDCLDKIQPLFSFSPYFTPNTYFISTVQVTIGD